jgi:hypothetical protein
VGSSISWVGFDRTGKAKALQAANLQDTGLPEETNESPFSGAEFPGYWFVLFSNDFGFVSPQRLAQLSVDCRIVACQVHEGIMFSAAYGYQGGRRVWELAHNAQRSINDLPAAGSPPPSFESIRRRLTREQETAPGDFIFDIPVEVAAAVCGFRHPRLAYERGRPQFTRLEVR